MLVLSILAGRTAYADPELKTIPESQPAHPRQVFRVVCEVTWDGVPAQYAILPAEIETIDWGTARVTGSRARAHNGTNVVSQTVEIVPDKVGEFTVPAIKIAFLHPEDISPSETNASRTAPPERGASPTLASDPFILRVQPDRTLAWVFGGLGVLVFCTALGWWSVIRIRRSRAERRPLSPPPDFGGAERSLKVARQHRINGEYYEFYLELNRALQVLSSYLPEDSLAARLQTRSNDVGFRGVRPTEDDMNGDVREVERTLKKIKEDMPS